METYFNEKFKEKVYLLEFTQNGTASEFFSFSVPPQSEDFDTPQRIGETKTFGGSVFEDYGNDVTKITLSGTTVNNNIRILYKNGNTETTDGEGEIFELQKIIQKYGEINNLYGKAVYLYALDSIDNKFWQVIINDFQIKRSKDNPLCYNYTISFTGFPPGSKVAFQFVPEEKSISTDLKSSFLWYENVQSWVHGLAEKIKACNDDLHSAYDGYQGFNTISDKINSLIDDIDTGASNLVDIYDGLVDVSNQFIEEAKGITTDIKKGFRLTESVISNLYTDTSELVDNCRSLGEWCENLNTKNILPETLETNNISDTDDLIYESISISQDMIFDATEIMAVIKKSINTTKILTVPGAEDEDDSVLVSYGYKQTTVTDSDTWDSLAYKYFGDSTLGGVIALFNGTEDGESILAAGNTIKIPILNRTEAVTSNNQIYSEPDEVNNYGTDVKLSDTGIIKDNYGDIAVVSGVENLEQAVDSRLQSNVSSRIKLATYGIKSMIGSYSRANNYIIASIRQTLMEEPRIKSIDSISFTGVGDTITASIKYTDINNIEHEYGGNL